MAASDLPVKSIYEHCLAKLPGLKFYQFRLSTAFTTKERHGLS